MCTIELKKAKQSYFQNTITNSITMDPKKAWNFMKPLLGNSTTHNTITHIKEGDNIYSNDQTISNAFANYSIKINDDITTQFPSNPD